MIVDLRSDTISMPTKEMLATILEAQLGDDGRTNSMGRGEDKAVNELEDLAAEMTGKEAGVIFPSGTMGNTAAILAHCQPGDKVLVDELQHIYISEKVVFDKTIGQLEPVTYKFDENGCPDLEDIRRKFEETGAKLICVENTHNFTGGAVIPVEHLAKIHSIAKEFGAHVHMDGARLFNAVVALGVDAKEICRHVDSVMFCVSKGLGAPIGSLVCCTQEYSMKVRAERKLLGGAMRQAGVFAAPGIYALKHNIARLREDHDNAAFVAEGIKDLKNTKICGKVMSNIIVLDVDDTGFTPSEYCEKAAEMGLLVKTVMSTKVRLVFFIDVTREGCKKAIEVIRELDGLKK